MRMSLDEEQPRIPMPNNDEHFNNNNDQQPTNNNNNLSRSFYKNGKLPLSVIKNGAQPKMNGNGINNNHEEYKMEISLKLNGNNDKQAEDDPLTGHRTHYDESEVSNCGLGGCKPKWASKYASTNIFMVVFLSAYVLQGCYLTYFVSVITTIEKLIHIKSATTGMLLSFSEVGQICTSLFLTYFAGRGHRPRWIACGMVLFAISAFGSVLPHFLFGDQLYSNEMSVQPQGPSSANLAKHMSSFNATSNQTMSPLDNSHLNLCLPEDIFNMIPESAHQDCDEDTNQDISINSELKMMVLIILACSLLGIGIGQTAISTLGIPYIDDNVASKDSPMYIAITIGVRILGPAGGFILGSFCTRIAVNLQETALSPSDPKYIGAWWLGLLLVATSMAFTSIAMFTFPRKLRGKRVQPAPIKMIESEENEKSGKEVVALKSKEDFEEIQQRPKLKDFAATIKRQLKNDILMFRTASSVLHLLPISGLYTYLPKYLETQFRMAPHNASLVSATAGILVMGFGIVLSGIVTLKFSPSARTVAAWIAFTALIYSIGMFVLSFVGCPMDDFAGLQNTQGLTLKNFAPPCELSCLCDNETFAPICGADGLTYYSACHAGCSGAVSDGGKWNYTECLCIQPPSASMEYFTPAVDGACGGKCQSNVMLFIVLFACLVFIHSTSEVGSMLLIMRCTHPKDKAMAMGVIQFAIGLFGNIPCPIIYGIVVDSACMVWTKICGKRGHCTLYDGDMFRHYFLGITSAIMGLAFIMDVIVWYKANRIDIDPEHGNTVAVSKHSINGGQNNDLLNSNNTLTNNHENDELKISIKDD